MRSRERRTDIVFGRVTAEEKALIRKHATERGTDISRLTRDLLLREIGAPTLDAERRASARLLQLFKRTTEASLELRDRFTVDRFRELWQEITKETT